MHCQFQYGYFGYNHFVNEFNKYGNVAQFRDLSTSVEGIFPSVLFLLMVL